MPNDIGLDLYEQIKALFDKKCAADKFISGDLVEEIVQGTATMQDVSLYSKQLGFRLRQAISETVTADVLPDGQMYFNIAEKILSPLLHDNYDLINDVAADVQKKLDAAKGIKIKPQKAPFPADRLKTVLNAASEPGLDEATMQRRMSVPAETITQSFADDYMQTNARFRNRAGIQAYIVRKDDGKCCDWCAKLAGRYSYPEGTPNDVFRRHDNCGCTVTYESGNMRQNAWTKKTWQASPEELAERRELEEKLKPVTFSPEEAAAKEKELLEKKAKSQTSEITSNFAPAKTIEEAQKYAEQFCRDEFMARSFKGVDFKGISVENANAINKALANVYNRVNLDKLSGIKAISPGSALGKKAFKDGADAVFSYDPIQHGIYINKSILKNSKTFAEYVKRSEEAWDTVMNNIDKLSGSQKELALLYKNAGRSLVDGETVEGMFTHELGHHAQWTLLDTKTNNSVGSRMKEYAPKISGYANASKGEYLAESFSAYMKGETVLLDPEYVKYLNSKTKNNN